MSFEVRSGDNDDARRELAVENMQRHVREACVTIDYDADIEYLGDALLAFADEWAQKDLA